METFRMISATACFLGIVITFFSRLYPSEKFEKQMKTIFSLVFLISILTPLLQRKLQLPDINETIAVGNSYYQEIGMNTDNYFISSVEKNISTRLETEMNKKNIFPLEIRTAVNISDNNSISINEVNVLVTDAEKADEIKSCIYACIGTDAAIIVKTEEGQYEY